MRNLCHHVIAISAAVFGLSMTSSSQAAWDLTNSNNAVTVMGNSFSRNGTATTGETVSVNASGWSAAAVPDTFSAASMTIWGTSGIGITNDPGQGGSEHGVDNLGNTDAVVLSFGSSVVLNQVRLGWYTGDSDISLLRWVGDASGPVVNDPNTADKNMGDMSLSSLVGSGWELVGDYSDLGTNAKTVNAGGKSSSWWMVSAYNSSYGGGNGWTQGNDYFKLASVAGSKGCTVNCEPGGSVPEPGSVALLALGLAAALGTTRRRPFTRSH